MWTVAYLIDDARINLCSDGRYAGVNACCVGPSNVPPADFTRFRHGAPLWALSITARRILNEESKAISSISKILNVSVYRFVSSTWLSFELYRV